MTKKLYSLLLILTPIKKVHAFQKFTSVLTTIVATNYEEILKKEILSWVQRIGNNTAAPHPSVINRMLPTLFLKLVIIYPSKCWNRRPLGKFITNAEAHLEPRQISAMEVFVLNVFARKSIIDFRLGSKYASLIEEDIWK